jgi:GT2 family glycosyltransferase
MWKSMDMPEGGNRVAVSIVHFGEAELTVAAVAAWRSRTDLPIYIVSNGPPSETARLTNMLSKDSSMHDVEVIETQANMGYGAAHNEAIDTAHAEGATWLILANNDLIPRLTGEDALLYELSQLPQDCVLAGCVIEDAGRVVRGGGHLQLWFARSSLTNMSSERSFVHGALMVLRLAANLRFDEAFFLYFEDVDLSLRVRRSGRTLGMLRELSASHMGGSTTGSTAAIKGRGEVVSFHAARSAVLLYRKNFPLLVPLAVMARMYLAIKLVVRNRNLAALKGVWCGATCPRTGAAWQQGQSAPGGNSSGVKRGQSGESCEHAL